MDEALPIIPRRGRPRIFAKRDAAIYQKYMYEGFTRSDLEDQYWNEDGLATKFTGKLLGYRAICLIITNQGQEAQRKFQR